MDRHSPSCFVRGVTPEHRRARLAGFALGTCAAACWGLGPVATKGALAGFSPEVVGVVRLATAAAFFRILAGRGTRWLPGDRWSALAGVALGVDFLLYNYGVRLTSAALAGLLINFGQVSNVALARLVLRESLTARRLFGAALTLTGVAIVNATGGLHGGGSLVGNVLIMLASAAWSTYAVAQQRVPHRSGNVFRLLAPIFVAATLVSALALVVPSAWENPGGRTPLLMLALLAGACTIAPYILFSRGRSCST